MIVVRNCRSSVHLKFMTESTFASNFKAVADKSSINFPSFCPGFSKCLDFKSSQRLFASYFSVIPDICNVVIVVYCHSRRIRRGHCSFMSLRTYFHCILLSFPTHCRCSLLSLRTGQCGYLVQSGFGIHIGGLISGHSEATPLLV